MTACVNDGKLEVYSQGTLYTHAKREIIDINISESSVKFRNRES